MRRTIIFDLGGVYFSDGTRIAIDAIAAKYQIGRHAVADNYAYYRGINDGPDSKSGCDDSSRHGFGNQRVPFAHGRSRLHSGQNHLLHHLQNN